MDEFIEFIKNPILWAVLGTIGTIMLGVAGLIQGADSLESMKERRRKRREEKERLIIIAVNHLLRRCDYKRLRRSIEN